METFLHTLEPFRTLTDALSSSKSISISNVQPMLDHIESQCNEEIAADVPEDCKALSSEMRSKIWNYIDSRCVKQSATFLSFSIFAYRFHVL